MLLRDSPHKGGAVWEMVVELADSAKGRDPGGYRADFVELVRQAAQLADAPARSARR